MNHFAIGLISFVAVFGAALIGIYAARALPEHHLSNGSRNAISVSAAIVGTLSSLDRPDDLNGEQFVLNAQVQCQGSPSTSSATTA